MTAGISDDQLVVRGGRLRPDDLEHAVLMSYVKVGRPGFSVHSAPATDPQALLDRVGTSFPHDEVSFARVGALREAGFNIEQTFNPPHHTVWLPEQSDLPFWVSQFRTTMSAVVRRADANTVIPLT